MSDRQTDTKGQRGSDNPHRILVTGSTGTIGSELIKALRVRNMNFSAMSTKVDTSENDISYVQGDFADVESLKKAFQGHERLFLLVPVSPDQEQFIANAVEAAKAVGIKYILRSSSWRADPQSEVLMARMQGETNELIANSGMAWTILRPNMFMQNLVNFSTEEIRSGTLYAPHGTAAMGLVDVRDIADVAATILANPTAHASKSYDLTGPETLTDNEQLSIVSKFLGRQVRYVDIPEEKAEEAMLGMGLPAIVIDWLMSLNRAAKKGWFGEVSDHVQQITGHAPRNFTDFVAENVDIWRS